MAVPGRSFIINLIGDSTGAEKAFKNVGQAAGRLPGPVGIATAAIAASFAAVVAVIGKVGKELFDLGQKFDDVYDNIRIQTGITGDALLALQDSFRDVARAVPNDFADVGVAIQDLNTRLGLTGQPLEDLAVQLLTVTRLMGGDVQTNVRNASRLFQNFGVEAEDQGDILDLLFKASQASGIGFDELSEQVTSNGAALRGLGFSLEDSIGMLALFEREGVDSGTIMSALERSIGRLAAAGGDIPTGFRDAIQSIREAGTQAEALGIAAEIVGARGANRLVDAVRQGRFDIDEFNAALQANGETILGAAGETDGFRESWDRFKNYIKLTLEPVATEVFANLEGVIGELQPAVDRVRKAFEEDGLEGALAQVAEEWDKIYAERIEPLWLKFLAFLNDVVKPIALEFGKQIGSAIASGMWSAFKSGVSSLFGPKFGERVLADLATSETLQLEVDLTPFGSLDLRTIPGMGGAVDFPSGPPAPSRPPRPSRSTSPSGSGQPDRSAFTVPRVPGGTVVPFAMGGIVTGPTLGLVGEAGPEAIIPLDRAGSIGGTVINVNVTGAVDPEATARQIRRILQDAERRSGVRVLA